MSTSVRAIVWLHAVLLLFGLSAGAVAQATKTHTVTGTVTDMNNAALGKVRVELHRDGRLVDAVETAATGSYEITFNDGAPIDLKFVEPGHDDASFMGLAGTSSQVINKALFKKGTGPSVASAEPAPSKSQSLPDAKTGQCYAQVLVPAKYNNKEIKVLKREASEKIEITPAKYELVEEKVLVAPEIERLKIIPAKYRTESQRVMTRPEQKKLVTEPAVYETVEEKVLVTPAYKTWKKGRGPIEKVDNATGEIMCLVEVPARHATIKKRVLKKPPSTRVEMLPAEYTSVKTTVLASERKVEKITIPAKYKTLKVWKEVTPAQEKRVPVPAEFETITQPVAIAEESMEWREILCETNATRDVIKRLQIALRKEGYKPGRIDGLLGGDTVKAVRAYQKKRGLASGEITIKTLESLGVSVGPG